MHYYQHHIGDFIKAASCLTESQAMRYLRLIWLYYDTEKPLQNNPKVLSLKVGGDETEVALILETFFRLDGDGWHNNRCDHEIATFKKMSDGGKKGACKRWGKGADSPPIAPPLGRQCTPNANQEPITNNQEPINTQSSHPDGFDSFWLIYPKKVGKPAAIKAFKAAKLNGHLSDVLSDIESKKVTDAWKKDSGQFIPNPATYLNQRRWEDVPTEVSMDLPKPDKDPALEKIERDKQICKPMPAAIREQLARFKAQA